MNVLQDELRHHLDVAKRHSHCRFQAIAPIVPEIDNAWTLVAVYFYPNSVEVMNAHFIGRFSSEAELQIFCDLNEIQLQSVVNKTSGS